MKKVIISLLVLTLLMASALSSCEWLKAEEPHECESLCTECGGCLNTECQDSACAEKCEGHIPPHKCESLCEECDGCLDAECRDFACAEKCEGHIPPHECESLCPECGGCIDTDFCTYEGCATKCTCERYVNVSKELADLLPHHLCIHHLDIDPHIFNVEKKINILKDGGQALLVTFEEVNTYYVGAYYFGNHYYQYHDPIHQDTGDTYCPFDYVFVRFDSAEEIERTYNNRELKGAFIVWEVLSVSDISSEDADAPKLVMYDRLTLNEDQFSVPDMPSESFIYINGLHTPTGTDTVYYSAVIRRTYRKQVTLTHVNIDGEDYLLFYNYDVCFYWGDIKKDFGKYYDALSEIMIPDIYNGYDCYLINVKDFAELLKGE